MPCIEIMWIYVVAGIMWIQICVLQGCLFGPGPECVFPCRCSDASGTAHLLTSGGSCDPITGHCQTGQCLSLLRTREFLRWGWHNDGCQYGNQAFRKTAFITDTGVEADNLVDGWIGREHDCTSIDTGNLSVAASVTVDLGGLYTIDVVGLHNIHDSAEYVGNFFVSTGYQAPSTTDICITYNQQSQGPPLGIRCNSPTPVRYITIEKTDTASDKHRLALCEISVTASPYYDVDCSRCNSTEKCHPDLWCEQCVEGWTGHDCNTALTPAQTPEPTTTPTTTPSSTTALRGTTTTSHIPNTDPTENNITPLPTHYNNPTPQTPSSTQPQDGNTDRHLSFSCTCDNSQVVVPAAILSVIVLILIALLVLSFCYNVRLRRKLKGTKTDRVGDFSDMDKSVYYNTAMGQAAMTVPGIQKPTHGGDGCEYEDVSGNKDTIHQDHTGTIVSPAEPQDSSYEAMQRQADYSNLPPPPAVYQELGTLGNK